MAPFHVPFPSELRNGLWHTTHPLRFDLIRISGAIVANPKLPESERWKTTQGAAYYPFVRTLNAISLFDFTDFEPDKYSNEYPLSTWWTFVPCRRDWDSSIWIEIDRALIEASFVPARQIIAMWNERRAYRHTVMPIVEAASTEPIPITAFRRVLCWERSPGAFREIRF